MNKSNALSLAVRAVFLGFAVTLLLAPASAQTKPINIALVSPIQIIPSNVAIAGFRWNIIYGKNSAMTGLDIGIANHVAGPMKGAQFGWFNQAESMVGWQEAIVNYTIGEAEGLQVGGVNYAGRINGLQLGLVNYAERANGVQLGLINIIKEGGFLPVMIIANWGFGETRQ